MCYIPTIVIIIIITGTYMLVLVVVGVQAVIVIVIRSVAVECRENDERAHPEQTIAHTSVHTPNEHTRAAAGARRE